MTPSCPLVRLSIRHNQSGLYHCLSITVPKKSSIYELQLTIAEFLHGSALDPLCILIHAQSRQCHPFEKLIDCFPDILPFSTPLSIAGRASIQFPYEIAILQALDNAGKLFKGKDQIGAGIASYPGTLEFPILYEIGEDRRNLWLPNEHFHQDASKEFKMLLPDEDAKETFEENGKISIFRKRAKTIGLVKNMMNNDKSSEKNISPGLLQTLNFISKSLDDRS
jgi:hypothetical protein